MERRQVPWRRIFGTTLTEWVVKRRAEGKSKKETLLEAINIVEKNLDKLPAYWRERPPLVFDHLRASISARWGQSKTLLKTYVAEKRTLGEWPAKVRYVYDLDEDHHGLGVIISQKVIDALGIAKGDAVVLEVKKVYKRDLGKWIYLGEVGR